MDNKYLCAHTKKRNTKYRKQRKRRGLLSSALRAVEALHTLLSSQKFVVLCAGVTPFRSKWVFKSLLLNCCKIPCGCSSVDLILVYVDLVSCQLLLNPFETELNQLMSVLAI